MGLNIPSNRSDTDPPASENATSNHPVSGVCTRDAPTLVPEADPDASRPTIPAPPPSLAPDSFEPVPSRPHYLRKK